MYPCLMHDLHVYVHLQTAHRFVYIGLELDLDVVILQPYLELFANVAMICHDEQRIVLASNRESSTLAVTASSD